ncbi:restriction endonuclease RKpn2kI [Mycoplasma wenyonii str. Massachusetts]|uniref:Restriction endonuclease RKpn2kI n=1 Tax=Mycoplasma wenyonii (strain Massachusetts) TaxID=1197325 RepID=I6Z604_MYCWM|nr:hypothetical protein [Mycoplasma wenyonii]AFN65003.1 restriction endonuclease RKpn2kI [Mycoplasma wenyonii str. Massachusetts]
MGEKEKFLITDHYFHHIKSFKGVHYLISPSHVHYLARRKEAIFLYIRISLSNWEEFVKDLLRDHKPKTDVFYVFTRDCFIPESVLQDCENYRIKLVTTAERKQAKYAGDPIVITLEKFFQICKKKYLDWKDYRFTVTEKEYLNTLFWEKFEKFREFPILKNWYWEQISNLRDSINTKNSI